MDRREYLGVVGSGAVVSLAGCQTAESILTGDESGSYTIGETGTYKGVEFTPTKYLLAKTLEREYSHNTEEDMAPDGATHILTHVSVVHNGDSEQRFPQTNTPSDVDFYYDGERVPAGTMSNIANKYIVDGTELVRYGQALFDNDATSGVYPGTEVEGWIAREVAANFDPAKLTVEVVWNNEPYMDGEEKTHEWTFTGDSEVSVGDVQT